MMNKVVQRLSGDTKNLRAHRSTQSERLKYFFPNDAARMRRVLYEHIFLSLLGIIDPFNVKSVCVLEPENDAPIGANRYAPVPLRSPSYWCRR